MRVFLAAFLVWLFGTSSAFAQGLVAESPNFVLHADTSVDAQAILSDLEAFRSAVLDDLDLDADRNAYPLQINIIRDMDVFNAISPGGITVAVYRTSAVSDDVVMGYSQSDDHLLRDALDPDWLRLVLRHEVVHHLIERHYPRRVPIWLMEGLAEYYSTYRADHEGGTRFGQPFPEQATLADLGGWLPTRSVIENLTQYPDFRTFPDLSAYRAQQIYYSQTRALANIILEEPDGLAKVQRFVEGWTPGEEKAAGETSFERAFGLDYAGLAERAQARESDYLSGDIDALSESDVSSLRSDIRVRQTDEDAIRTNHLRLLLTHGRKTDPVETLIETFGQSDTQTIDPVLTHAFAFRALRMNALDLSDDLTAALLLRNPDDALALRLRAQVAYKRLGAFQTDDELWLEAEEAAIRALALNPDDEELHLFRAAVSRPTSNGLPEDAIRSLDWLEARDIHARLPNTAMMMVPALSYVNRFDYADQVLDSAARWAINPADAWVIDEFRATVERQRLEARAASVPLP